MTKFTYTKDEASETFTVGDMTANRRTILNTKNFLTNTLSGVSFRENENSEVQVPLISTKALNLAFKDVQRGADGTIQLTGDQGAKLVALLNGFGKGLAVDNVNVKELQDIYKAFEGEVHGANEIMDNFMAKMIKTAVGVEGNQTYENNFKDLATALENASAAYSHTNKARALGNAGLTVLYGLGTLAAALVDVLVGLWSQLCRALNTTFVSQKTKQEVMLKWECDSKNVDKSTYEAMQGLLTQVQEKINKGSSQGTETNIKIIDEIVGKGEENRDEKIELLKRAVNNTPLDKDATRFDQVCVQYAIHKALDKDAQVAGKDTPPFYKGFLDTAKQRLKDTKNLMTEKDVGKATTEINKQELEHKNKGIEKKGDDNDAEEIKAGSQVIFTSNQFNNQVLSNNK